MKAVLVLQSLPFGYPKHKQLATKNKLSWCESPFVWSATTVWGDDYMKFLNTYLLVYIVWLNQQLINSLTCLGRLISNCAAVVLHCFASNSSVAFVLFYCGLNNIRSLGTKRQWTASNGFSLHAAWIIDALIAWVFMDTKRLFLFSV